MKLWKVDYFKAYTKTDLEDKLNGMQINGKHVESILYNSKYDEYEIIYTIEDSEEDSEEC